MDLLSRLGNGPRPNHTPVVQPEPTSHELNIGDLRLLIDSSYTNPLKPALFRAQQTSPLRSTSSHWPSRDVPRPPLSRVPSPHATTASPLSTRAAQPYNNQNDTGNASLAEAQSHKLRNRCWSARGGLSGGAVCPGEDWGGEAAHDRRAHCEREVRNHHIH
jgi:hypothetical protein